MAILDDVKISLRISSSAYDTEINDLISACKSDLTISGINTTDDTDTLIKRCINLYVKSQFGYNNPDAVKLMESYNMLKNHLALSNDYAFYTVTFTITDADTSNAIHEAYVKLWNSELNYIETKGTDENGQVIFYVRARSNYKYDVSATDYTSDEHDEDDKNISDVTANTAIAVSLEPN